MKIQWLSAVLLVSFVGLQGAYAQENQPGSQHIFYPSGGHIYEVLNSGGWSIEDLTALTGAPFAESGTHLTSFHDAYGLEVFYSTGGRMIELYWNGSWTYVDLTSLTGYTSQSGTPLTGFTNNIGEHVFSVTSNGRIDELFYNGSTWVSELLWGGSPPASLQPMGSFANGSNTEHLFFTAMDGSVPLVYELYYNGSTWAATDLTLLTHDSTAPSSPWGVFAIFDNLGEEIFHREASFTDQYYWNPKTGWSNGALPGVTPDGTNVITGFANSNGEHFYYVHAANLHVYELYYNYATKTWSNGDITTAANAPAAVGNTALAAYTSSGNQYIYYSPLQNGVLEELFWSPTSGWTSFNLGAIGAPPNDSNTSITTFNL